MLRVGLQHGRRFLGHHPWAFRLATHSLIALSALSLLVSAASSEDASRSGQRGQAGVWTTLAPAPSKRTEVVAAASDGKIYVLGGFLEPGLSALTTLAITDRVEEYTPATNVWVMKAAIPNGVHHAGAAVVGGKLYLIGGYTRSFLSVWSPVASVYMYDPDSNVWTVRAPMPTARGALAVVEMQGKLYAMGGYDHDKNTGALEVYDPAANSWATKAPLPTPRDHLTAAVVRDRIYAIGGRLNGNYSQNLPTVEAYDLRADRWNRIADMPTARSGITAGVIRDTIYVVGGEAPEGTFRTNESYHPESDRWQTESPMPTGRHGLASAVVNDRLYVIGGGPTPGGSFSDTNEVFTPANPSASDSGNRTPRSRASAKHVGTVMALLAAFEDADALPQESSPEATRLIKGLIQFQAAFMQSADPAVREFLRAALTEQLGERGTTAAEDFRTEGWSSTSLEAVVKYAAAHHPWHRADLLEGFRAFNVGPAEFDVVAKTYQRAQANLANRGQDLHVVYAARRREMPGARM